MTTRQLERIKQLEQYAREQRTALGYGSYPRIAENAVQIETLTNVLAYCILIRENN